jgi:DNA-binding CsgD family transcriptional regulator
MSINDLRTVERLSKVVSRLTSQPDLREDLIQEALIHLWLIQERQPGQSESWYLQSCRYHLQHLLVAGRSVDSLKRRAGNAQISHADPDDPSLLPVEEALESGDPMLAEISVRDMISTMSQRLSPREQEILRRLAEGYRTCEIARHLKLSHPTVVKSRRKIAAMLDAVNGPTDQRVRKNGRLTNSSPRQRNGEGVALVCSESR